MPNWRTIVITLALLTAAGILAVQYATSFTDFASTFQNNPATRDVECGVRCLLMASRLLGVPVEMDELASVPVDPAEGTSFGDLKQGARRLGFEAWTARIGWDELQQHQGAAILLVDGNHFVVAMPEPRGGAGQTSVTVHDPNASRQDWTRQELQARWQGETMLMRPSEPPAAPSAPQLQWATCWLDLGVIRDSDQATYTIPYTNSGPAELELNVLRTSCNCAQAVLSDELLAPAESGTLTAVIDLKGKRGRFSESVVVGANVPDRPAQRLVLCGTAANLRELVSVRKAHFGALLPSQQIERELYFHDPGVGELEVLEVAVAEAATRPVTAAAPLCRASFQRLDPAAVGAATRSRYDLREGDYVIKLQLQVPADAPPCQWQANLRIRTNLERVPEANVEIACSVRSDVEAVPSAVLLSNHAQRRDKSVQLVSHTGRELTIAQTQVSDGLPVAVRRDDKRPAQLVIQRQAAGESSELREGHVLVTLDDGGEVKIPVVILGSESNPKTSKNNGGES